MRQQDSSREFVARAMARAKFNRRAIQFLIDFSEADPMALAVDQAALLKFIAGVYEFNFYRSQNIRLHKEPIAKYVSQLATEIQADPEILSFASEPLRDLLAAAADGTDHTIYEPFPPETKLIFLGSSHPHASILWMPEGREQLGRALAGSALQLLQSEEGEMVRRCRRENCRLGPRDKEHLEGQRRIFLANSPRQEYCGRQCSTAASFLRFKEKHEGASVIHATRDDQNAGALKRRKRQRNRAAESSASRVDA